MSAAFERIRELVYPTKPRLYVGLGDPPDTRVTAHDLKTIIDELTQARARVAVLERHLAPALCVSCKGTGQVFVAPGLYGPGGGNICCSTCNSIGFRQVNP